MEGCNYVWCKECQQEFVPNGPKHSCDGSSELKRLVEEQGWKYCPGEILFFLSLSKVRNDVYTSVQYAMREDFWVQQCICKSSDVTGETKITKPNLYISRIRVHCPRMQIVRSILHTPPSCRFLTQRTPHQEFLLQLWRMANQTCYGHPTRKE